MTASKDRKIAFLQEQNSDLREIISVMGKKLLKLEKSLSEAHWQQDYVRELETRDRDRQDGW